MAFQVLNRPVSSPAQIEDEIKRQVEEAIAPTSPYREYVCGGGDRTPVSQWFQQLPAPDDDLDNLVGNDVYTRMGNDEQITASTFLLIMMTLRREMTLDPAFADADKGSEDFKKATEIRDFCQRALDNLENHYGSCYRMLWEMLYNAMRFGHAVAEITYEFGADEDSDKLLFKYIKVKPRQSTAFVVDRHFNVLGLATYTGPLEGWLGAMTDAVKTSHFIPTSALGTGWTMLDREKFAVLSLLTENNDPRGKSWWRSIYNAWYQKMRRLRQLDLYAQRFGLPVPLGVVGEHAQAQHPLDDNGRPDTTKPKVTPEEALLSALTGFQAGDALSVPFGTEVELNQNTGDGGSLMLSLQYHDSQIVKGITFQKLATSPDAHQAKASAGVHQDVLNSPPYYLKAQETNCVRMQMLWPLVKANFGAGARKYLPKPNLGKIDPEDLATLLTALGNALRSGGVHRSMLPEIWQDWGLPAVDMDQWLADLELERDIIGQMTAPATGKDAQPGQTQGDKYVAQETGKRGSRNIGSKISGRHGTGFSEEEQDDDE